LLPTARRKATNVSLVGALFFVRIDWAAKTHAVCVLDPAGRSVAAFGVEQTASGFTGLIRRLARLGDPGAVPVAIERPDGRLVDALLAAGHPVVPAKPNAIKTWREGEVISGAKPHPGDAHVIAEYLRLRAHRLRAATPLTEHTTAAAAQQHRLVADAEEDRANATVNPATNSAAAQPLAICRHGGPAARPSPAAPRRRPARPDRPGSPGPAAPRGRRRWCWPGFCATSASPTAAVAGVLRAARLTRRPRPL